MWQQQLVQKPVCILLRVYSNKIAKYKLQLVLHCIMYLELFHTTFILIYTKTGILIALIIYLYNCENTLYTLLYLHYLWGQLYTQQYSYYCEDYYTQFCSCIKSGYRFTQYLYLYIYEHCPHKVFKSAFEYERVYSNLIYS